MSVGFINCYSLRSSLRLPERDSTLLHDSSRLTKAVARANRWSVCASHYDRFRQTLARRWGNMRFLNVEAKYVSGTRRDMLARHAYALSMENVVRYIGYSCAPSSLATPYIVRCSARLAAAWNRWVWLPTLVNDLRSPMAVPKGQKENRKEIGRERAERRHRLAVVVGYIRLCFCPAQVFALL